MNTEKLGASRFMNVLFGPAGALMESRLRHKLFPPMKTLCAAGLKQGQTVLEVGCGSGFFTLPAAELIGNAGRLIAMDPLAAFVDKVKSKVRKANLRNVEVIRRDALNTGLETASVDVVLLLGVLPSATLPLSRLLPEMHRILKADGTMAVWLFPFTFGVPSTVRRTRLFGELGKKNGVYTYRRRDAPT